MDINVKINQLIDKNGLKAKATVNLDNMISISNIAIVEGENGLFLGYPQKNDQELVKFKLSDKGDELKAEIKKAVIDKYNEALKDESIVGYSNNYTDKEKKQLNKKAEENLNKIRVFVNVKEEDRNQKATGRIEIDNAIKLEGLRVMSDKDEKLFVALPSHSYEEDEQRKYREIYFPVTATTREKIIELTQQEYQRGLENLEKDTEIKKEEQEEQER